jgi:hypothetical protein
MASPLLSGNFKCDTIPFSGAEFIKNPRGRFTEIKSLVLVDRMGPGSYSLSTNPKNQKDEIFLVNHQGGD